MENKYVERLFNEWKQHGRIILALDFDGTLAYWNTLENQEDIERCIKLVHVCQRVGCYVVIHTACNPARHDEIIKYCELNGIRADAININPIEMPFGKNNPEDFSKIYYNHQLCDRSGFIEAMDILESAVYKYSGWLKSNEHLDDVA